MAQKMTAEETKVRRRRGVQRRLRRCFVFSRGSIVPWSGVMGDSDFTIEVHHGENFVDKGHGLEYLGEVVVDDLHFDVDEWYLQEIVSELKKLGYKGYARLWYKEPELDLNSRLREMKSDGDVMRMTKSLVFGSVKHCEVYVVDRVKEDKGIEITSSDVDYMPEEGEDSDSGLLEVEVDAESEPSTKEEAFDDSADDGDHEGHFGVAQDDGGLGEVDDQIGDIYDGFKTEDIDSCEKDSDDMIKKKRFPRYSEAEMSREDIKFKKNDKVKYRVVCIGRKSKCKIKTLKHTCGRNYSSRLASSNWISKKIANNISRGEKMELAIVIQTIQDKYMANINVGKAYWPRFLRMYICLDAVKQGFLAGCKPIIGVEGDHGQQLLVIVKRDPNDNYFLIVMAAVDVETKDS
ncbi:uncharacterized protein LOC130957585 [Arachis stenosperma]|uniref:uncharacterized protein LOC130957585 n=1 Tax=Arachis stenosperma TaxID=217475 RepID=UPI0025AC3ACB|nr:uncharacterized protein LOC130957585 [Arachis stenosperma]